MDDLRKDLASIPVDDDAPPPHPGEWKAVALAFAVAAATTLAWSSIDEGVCVSVEAPSALDPPAIVR